MVLPVQWNLTVTVVDFITFSEAEQQPSRGLPPTTLWGFPLPSQLT